MSANFSSWLRWWWNWTVDISDTALAICCVTRWTCLYLSCPDKTQTHRRRGVTVTTVSGQGWSSNISYNKFWSIVIRRDIDQRNTYSYVFGRRIYDDRVRTCMNESYIHRYFLRLLRLLLTI
jgi:hypothetical protein